MTRDVVIGVDVGGTDLKLAAAGDSGVMDHVERVAARHGPDSVDWVADQVSRFLHERVRDGESPIAVGLVAPGRVDALGGVVTSATNLQWRHVPVREVLSARTNLPVAVGHDVLAAGIAEANALRGAPFQRIVYISIGTGIALASFVDGGVQLGGGMTGELGHMTVDSSTPCACGGVGCLEAIASARAISSEYARRTNATPIRAAGVFARARAGDEAAAVTVKRAAHALAGALGPVVAMLRPEVVILGGGVAMAGDQLTRPLARELDRTLSPNFERPRIWTGSFGQDAGLQGALQLGRSAVPS